MVSAFSDHGHHREHYRDNLFDGTHRRLPSSNKFDMTTSVAIEARGLAAQLGRAESDIHEAAQNLEQIFFATNDQARELG